MTSSKSAFNKFRKRSLIYFQVSFPFHKIRTHFIYLHTKLHFVIRTLCNVTLKKMIFQSF